MILVHFYFGLRVRRRVLDVRDGHSGLDSPHLGRRGAGKHDRFIGRDSLLELPETAAYAGANPEENGESDEGDEKEEGVHCAEGDFESVGALRVFVESLELGGDHRVEEEFDNSVDEVEH